MRWNRRLLLAAVCVGVLAVASKGAAQPKTNPLVDGSNDFAFDLWGRMKASKGNLAFSPASISVAMAMSYGGAKGKTAAQMRQVMHFQGPPEKVMSSWGTLSRSLTVPSGRLKLLIANRLFGEKTFEFKQPYLEQTRTAFGAPLETLDFKSASEASRVRINGWVEEQTEKRIAQLIPPDGIDDLTRLVLVNAIYFKAEWVAPFRTWQTLDEPFRTTASSQKQVPTMHQVSQLRLAQANGVQVLELPYAGGSMAMLVALPDRVDGLHDLEAGLSRATLAGWTERLAGHSVDVSLPRFEVRPEPLALSAELEALGMPLAFDRDRADFKQIADPLDPRERLHIAEVFHKAFVKVDEKGTEAAAATALGMAAGGGGPPPKPIEFKADHPFLFFIVDRDSGLVVFMGRVVEP